MPFNDAAAMVFYSLQNFITSYIENKDSEYKFPPLQFIFNTIQRKIIQHSPRISHFFQVNEITSLDFIAEQWSQLFLIDRSLEDAQVLMLYFILSPDPPYSVTLLIAAMIAELDVQLEDNLPEFQLLFSQMVARGIRSMNVNLLMYNVDKLRIFFDTYGNVSVP